MICIPHEYYINTFGDNRLKPQNYMATPLENAPFTEELFNGVTFLTQVLSAGGGVGSGKLTWQWKTKPASHSPKNQDIFESWWLEDEFVPKKSHFLGDMVIFGGCTWVYLTVDKFHHHPKKWQLTDTTFFSNSEVFGEVSYL